MRNKRQPEREACSKQGMQTPWGRRASWARGTALARQTTWPSTPDGAGDEVRALRPHPGPQGAQVSGQMVCSWVFSSLTITLWRFGNAVVCIRRWFSLLSGFHHSAGGRGVHWARAEAACAHPPAAFTQEEGLSWAAHVTPGLASSRVVACRQSPAMDKMERPLLEWTEGCTRRGVALHYPILKEKWHFLISEIALYIRYFYFVQAVC